jgi:hypothetical protein
MGFNGDSMGLNSGLNKSRNIPTNYGLKNGTSAAPF